MRRIRNYTFIGVMALCFSATPGCMTEHEMRLYSMERQMEDVERDLSRHFSTNHLQLRIQRQIAILNARPDARYAEPARVCLERLERKLKARRHDDEESELAKAILKMVAQNEEAQRKSSAPADAGPTDVMLMNEHIKRMVEAEKQRRRDSSNLLANLQQLVDVMRRTEGEGGRGPTASQPAGGNS